MIVDFLYIEFIVRDFPTNYPKVAAKDLHLSGIQLGS